MLGSTVRWGKLVWCWKLNARVQEIMRRPGVAWLVKVTRAVLGPAQRSEQQSYEEYFQSGTREKRHEWCRCICSRNRSDPLSCVAELPNSTQRPEKNHTRGGAASSAARFTVLGLSCTADRYHLGQSGPTFTLKGVGRGVSNQIAKKEGSIFGHPPIC